jgi:hypothetical protein
VPSFRLRKDKGFSVICWLDRAMLVQNEKVLHKFRALSSFNTLNIYMSAGRGENGMEYALTPAGYFVLTIWG